MEGTIARLWVTNNIATPVSSTSPTSDSSTVAATLTSSAEVTSSQSSNRGRAANARAIATLLPLNTARARAVPAAVECQVEVDAGQQPLNLRLPLGRRAPDRTG